MSFSSTHFRTAMQGASAPAGGITGSLSKTLANVTQSGTAKVTAKGSLSKPLGALALVSTSIALVRGTTNVQLQGITSPAVGHVPVKATEQRTLQSVTIASSAKIRASGSVSQSLEGLALEATAEVPATPVQAVVSALLENVHGMSPVAQGVVTGRSAGGTGYSRRGTVGKLTDDDWDKARKAFAKARRKRKELEAKTNPKAAKQLASAVSRETQAYIELASIDAIRFEAFRADATAFYANEEEELMFILALAA